MKRIVSDRTCYFKEETKFAALTDIDPERLKLFAAIGIEFTSLEALIDFGVRELLRLRTDETDVVSRINGFDGKVGIFKSVTQSSATLRGEAATRIAHTLGEISKLKTYRDAVAHANIHNPNAEMARTSIKHGKPYEVDISIPTLSALLGRIMGMQKEMVAALSVSAHHFTEWDLEDHDYADASEVTNNPHFQQHLAQFRECQANPKLLPTISPLREEGELLPDLADP